MGMRLWTIQTAAAWEALQQQGMLRGERRFLWDGNDPGDEVLRAYDWLREQMTRRIGACPCSEVYPVWAWAQWNGARRPRPHLRSSEYRDTQGVRLEIEIPESQALLSDFDLWHYPLNYWYLSASEQDDQQFEQRCAERGLDVSRMKPLPDQALHEQLVASWERIFDLSWIYEPVTGAKCKEDRRIQATFWTLQLKDVQSVRFFAPGPDRDPGLF